MNFKKFFKIVFVFVFLFCLITGIVFGALYMINPNILNGQNILGSIFYPIIGPQNPINILILGTDKVGLNTDVMVVANINPQTKEINVMSIPRDTKVKYKGTHKINSIYGREKEQSARQQLVKEIVGEIIQNKIDYVVVANPEGFRNIIDILGGVEVGVPDKMDYDDYDQDLHIHLKKGLQVLNGKKSEEFVRYRHGYAEGDIGRINAQQIFFKAFVEQKIKPQYILKADKILGEIFKYVKTDISLDAAIKYAMLAKDIPSEKISFYMLPGEPKNTSPWYFIYDPVKIEKEIKDKFSLEIKPKTSNEQK